jgi:hypothetical protein
LVEGPQTTSGVGYDIHWPMNVKSSVAHSDSSRLGHTSNNVISEQVEHSLLGCILQTPRRRLWFLQSNTDAKSSCSPAQTIFRVPVPVSWGTIAACFFDDENQFQNLTPSTSSAHIGWFPIGWSPVIRLERILSQQRST